MPRPRTSSAAVCIAAALLLGGCTAQPAATAAVPVEPFAIVVGLVAERLETAPDVAAAKRVSGAPVTDAARETAVLDAATALAADAGTSTDLVAEVFRDQIEANKVVQTTLLDAWSSGSTSAPTSAPDLATEVRPVLDRITPELVTAIAAIEPYRGDSACGSALDAAREDAPAPSDAAVADALPIALAHVCAGS